jgi:hypothetical protein
MFRVFRITGTFPALYLKISEICNAEIQSRSLSLSLPHSARLPLIPLAFAGPVVVWVVVVVFLSSLVAVVVFRVLVVVDFVPLSSLAAVVFVVVAAASLSLAVVLSVPLSSLVVLFSLLYIVWV